MLGILAGLLLIDWQLTLIAMIFFQLVSSRSSCSEESAQGQRGERQRLGRKPIPAEMLADSSSKPG